MLTYSLHKIKYKNHFEFNPAEYSRFKFGDEAIAKTYGTDLANGFIAAHSKDPCIQKQIVVISSPYAFIPTATFAMKNHFVYRLNRWLAEMDTPVVQESKVHRTITYKEDYGELSAQERISLIGNDAFYIDKGFLENKFLIFLDDIKITGSHEKMILKMINDFDLKNDIALLYFAELINNDIHPNIENHLNYYSVKSIFDLAQIIESGNFFFNTRIVKYILSAHFESFQLFIENQTDNFINTLYNLALGNSYHTIKEYQHNLSFIKQFLITSKVQLH